VEPISSKEKAAIGELAVASDLLKRGFHVLIPFGDYSAYDLVIERSLAEGSSFERVQVKYTKSDGDVIKIKARSHSVVKGNVTTTRLYDPTVAEWVAAYDATTDACYYIPTTELVSFISGEIHLRLSSPKNGKKSVRWADEYTQI